MRLSQKARHNRAEYLPVKVSNLLDAQPKNNYHLTMR